MAQVTKTPEMTLPPITDDEIARVDAWWRADNYLTVGQIYLMENPLLRQKLSPEHIKPRLLGHWGTSPGLSFEFAHLQRLVRLTGQSAIFITGPGHGGPAIVGASYLEGSYTECFPKVTQDEPGMRTLFRQFSAPGGIPSHASVTTPGSIHEGGELGYALIHAFGSVMDNPDLLTLAVVGDGEAETGPLEGSWKGISFINPERDGAVLPILHLNENKIAGPTVLGRKSRDEVHKLFEGHGYRVIEVSVPDDDSAETIDQAHRDFAAALADAYGEIRRIQVAARGGDWDGKRPNWPMIIFRHPKGWTGPHEVDGTQVEGTWRAHQVPLAGVKDNADHLAVLEQWLKSYRPEELFDEQGRPVELVSSNNPEGELRISANPVANGGLLTTDLDLPDFRELAVQVDHPAQERVESTRKLGEFMKGIYEKNPHNFRLFCPDETNSNRLGAIFDVTDRGFMEQTHQPQDGQTSRDGRVMEVLSEHNCHGWLEGYNLTGRHGMFATYESFAMVSASQTIQHGKWLDEANDLDWRADVPSLNILLTSTCWRNDHNGFSHQGPGLIQNVLTQRGEVARVYLPPDANSLLSVADHCFRSRNYLNLIVIDKQPQPQWMGMDEAIKHCEVGAGIWQWAGNEDDRGEPDVVLASAGDVVTMETVAAAEILKQRLPGLKTRVVNVVDLMTLIRPKDHPHGMDETRFAELFTTTKDVIFAFHGYPGAIHQLVHGRPDADRFRVRGFIEQGTTTTPFDMVVRNRVSRYHLVMDAINNALVTPPGASELKAWCQSQLARHEEYIVEHLEDMPEVSDWKFGYEQTVTETPEQNGGDTGAAKG